MEIERNEHECCGQERHERDECLKKEQACRENKTFEEEFRGFNRERGFGENGDRFVVKCLREPCRYEFDVDELVVEECDCHGKLILKVCGCDNIKLCDGQPIKLRFRGCAPRGNPPRQVFIELPGHKPFPMEDRIGDLVFDNQVTPHYIYKMYFGADRPHYTAINILRTPRY